MKHLFEYILPFYITLWPTTLTLAIWSAPVRYIWTPIVDGRMENHSRHDTYWQALRITLRAEVRSRIIRVIKKGII